MIVKAGDTHATHWRANADLTGADVRLIARRRAHPTVVLEATVQDGPDGLVLHRLTGDLEPGAYRIELEVTRDGRMTTYPNGGYATLTVKPDLR